MEEMEVGNKGGETKLDCCDHTFCYACIKKWLDCYRTKKQCPLCKKQVTKLTYREADGSIKTTEIICEPESSFLSDYDSEVDEHVFCQECLLWVHPSMLE